MRQVEGWALFFVVYAALFYRAMSWGAALRIAGTSSTAISGRVGFFACVAVFAVTPGFALPFSRIAFGWADLSDAAFALFMLAWVAAALPGIRQNRRRLRQAGINPDAEV